MRAPAPPRGRLRTAVREDGLTIVILLSFVAITFALTYPLWLKAADHQLGGGVDPWLYIWTVGWDVHALTHAPWSIFDAPIFYPNPNALAYSEHLIGAAALGAPVVWLTGNATLATNIIAMMSVLLCAIGGYVLGRALGFSQPAAFLCGVVFAFTPPRFGRIYQLHLATIHWVPFALAFLHRYLRDGRPRDIRLAALFLSLQALTSGHGTALLVLGAAMTIGHALLTGATVEGGRRLRDIGIPGALALLPTAFIIAPYWRARQDVGLTRSLEDTGVALSSWFASTSVVDTLLAARLPDWDWLRQEPDVYLFPGVLPVALGLIGVVIARRDPRVRLYAAVAAVCVWLTIGPPFGVWQWVYWIPGFSFIRVPSRFMLLGMLALAVLAAMGFERMTARSSSKRRVLLGAALGALLVTEFAAVPLDVRPFHIKSHAVDLWLNTRPKPFSAVELPVPQSSLVALVARRHAEYMLHSMAHFQPIAQGYSGTVPPGWESLEFSLMLFPSDASIRALAELGVDYAVVHMDYVPPELTDHYVEGLERFQRDGKLRLLHEDGPGRVYRIVRAEGETAEDGTTGEPGA